MCDGSLKAIEDLREGDWVWARNESTGEMACKQVVDPYSNPQRSIILLTLVDEDGRSETIETTDNHPFYVEGYGWTRVDKLQIGDAIPAADGRLLVLVGAEWTNRIETVYNFGVEGFHNYFVGQNQAWVHNCTVAELVEAANGSARTAANLINAAADITQDQAIEVIEKVLASNGRKVGAVVPFGDDGTKLMLPKVGNNRAPVVRVTPDGQATFGTAKVEIVPNLQDPYANPYKFFNAEFPD
jgi:hypothetical protein